MTIEDYKVGITGNWYYTSKNKKELEVICDLINKSKSSIYYNTKYSTYAVRIKSKLVKNYIASKVVPSKNKNV